LYLRAKAPAETLHGMTRQEIGELFNEEEKIFAEEANLIQLESGIRISVNRMPSS
jgi:hypothetical protein